MFQIIFHFLLHAVGQNDLSKYFERIENNLQNYRNICCDEHTELFILREKDLLDIWRSNEVFFVLINKCANMNFKVCSSLNL